MKAYILNKVHGTVQIGHTIFQPCTGNKFISGKKGLGGKRAVEVKDCSMESAVEALRQVED